MGANPVRNLDARILPSSVEPVPSMTAAIARGGQKSFKIDDLSLGEVFILDNPRIRADTIPKNKSAGGAKNAKDIRQHPRREQIVMRELCYS